MLTKTKPWSSSGRKDVGRRAISSQTTPQTARKISIMRLARRSEYATVPW